MGARSVIERWRQRIGSPVSPVVLSEIPRTILPPESGATAPIGTGGPIAIPKGFHACTIAGEARICVDANIPRGRDAVLEPFDPNVVIGQVGGPDTQSQSDTETEEMAHDWGHLLREGIQGAATTWFAPEQTVSGFAGPGPQTPAQTQAWLGGASTGAPSGVNATCEPCGPRYLTYDCKTGKFSKKRRRGRRRLATDRDLSDLAAIVAITGKGSAMNQAVAGMVRR